VNDPKHHAFVCLVKFGDETVDPISCPDMSHERGSGEPTADRRDIRRVKTELDPDELFDARDGWLGSDSVLRADPQIKDIPILAMTAVHLKSSFDTASR
jgi:hypothetical protein